MACDKFWAKYRARIQVPRAFMQFVCGLSGHIGHAGNWSWNAGWFCIDEEEWLKTRRLAAPHDRDIRAINKKGLKAYEKSIGKR